ncbi:sensor histidine kinase [Microbacterium resistens]|uniref:sensor histidine kinase n=1 Tax=Microbacterium resistens TaxID=156977 RepID=UPI00082D7F72|nr:histidine kinase [Microbacterium resistens]
MTSAPPSPLDRAAGRWQRHPRAVDAVTALSWVVLTVLPALGAGVGEDLQPGVLAYVLLGLVVVVFSTVLVLFRRRRPLLVFAVAFVSSVLLMPFWSNAGTVGAAYAVFAVAVYDSVRRAWVAAAAAYALTVAQSGIHLLTGIGLLPVTRDGNVIATVVSYLVFDLLLLLVALLWGQNAGNRRRYVEALLERARILEHERDQEAQLAALAERSRIARDVHDIVSHSLSVIVRLADGATAVLAADPDRAGMAVTQIGGVARSSLDEMRRALGVLERAADDAGSRTSTGIEDLPRLVEVYRGIGLPVELSVVSDGTAEVSAGKQMTVFRVVQESLTNAMRHAVAPGVVGVEVRVDGAEVTATVHDDGRPVSAPPDEEARVGRGLVGMRERALLYGGSLDAGPLDPRNGAGWVVRLILPGDDR